MAKGAKAMVRLRDIAVTCVRSCCCNTSCVIPVGAGRAIVRAHSPRTLAAPGLMPDRFKFGRFRQR
jgi:hypothetical protein